MALGASWALRSLGRSLDTSRPPPQQKEPGVSAHAWRSISTTQGPKAKWKTHHNIFIWLYMYRYGVYIYIHVYIIKAHTHTYIYMCMYIYICVCARRVIYEILYCGCCMFKRCTKMCQTCCMIVTQKTHLEWTPLACRALKHFNLFVTCSLVHQKPLHSAVMEILQESAGLGVVNLYRPNQNNWLTFQSIKISSKGTL